MDRDPALVASVHFDRYQANTGRRVSTGLTYNVAINGMGGTVICGLPHSWATRAALHLNACETVDAQRVELARIREALADYELEAAA